MSIGKGHKMRVVPTNLTLYWERFHSPAWRDLRIVRNETAEREAYEGLWLNILNRGAGFRSNRVTGNGKRRFT